MDVTWLSYECYNPQFYNCFIVLLFIHCIIICDIFLSLAAELSKDTLGKLLPICAILKVRNYLTLRTDLYSNTLLVCVCQ